MPAESRPRSDLRPHLAAAYRTIRRCGVAGGTLLALAVTTLATATPATADEPRIAPTAVEQILYLQAAKAARTPAQHKMGSSLLVELDRRSGGPLAKRVPTLRSAVPTGGDGRVTLDLEGEVTPRLAALVEQLGGVVVNSHPRFGAMRLRMPWSGLEELAADPDVRTLAPADRVMLQMLDTTEGDVAHGTDLRRIELGVDGTGVKACAMSDSVDALADLQASGDLPPSVDVLTGQSGNPGSSEGTALLEILHDMAPGAALGFATGFGGQAQMAQNILDLATSGCDVIVDDVGYLGEAVFQDGIIAQAVDEVVATGVLYFSSAGNSGSLAAGTSGVWEGDYSPETLPAVLTGTGLSAHDFSGGDVTNEITEQTLNPTSLFTLQWADPLGASTNDYDLYLLDAAGTSVIDASTSSQSGTQDPLEAISSAGFDDTGNQLVVVLFGGDPRFLHLNTHRGRLEHGTSGQIFGHTAAVGALAVGAVDVATAGGGLFTGGPANPVEDFSSDGPRRIFFEADGDPVALLSAAPPAKGGMPSSQLRDKPDLSAADGVSTATPGFSTFFGTSASAPHAAAIATLFRQLNPAASVSQAYGVFRSSTLDIEGPGFDENSGNGILMADAVVEFEDIFSDGFESGNTSAWSNTVE